MKNRILFRRFSCWEDFQQAIKERSCLKLRDNYMCLGCRSLTEQLYQPYWG
jgi:hypothetical protein